MGIITSLLGIVCILYYIAGVRYAGYRVSGLWIWLAAGIGLMVWGGCRIGCAVAGVPFFVPGALVAIVRVCLLAGLVLFFYLEHQIGTGMKAKGIENLDYIVVLGCQVKGTKPSKALKDRLDTAKEIVKEVKDSNSFTIIEGYPVNAAYLSNNGKYLMIYNDTKIDKNNPKKDSNEYKARENAVEDFLAFKN